MASYGYTFQSGDGVTPTRLNAARTVSDIVNADIKSDAAIAHSKLANIPSGQLLLGNGSNVPTATAVTGDVTISSAGVTAITAGAIVTADLADGAVTSGKIADGTIVNADVAANAAIAGTKIVPDFGSQVVTMGNTVNVGGADSTNTIVNIGAGATGNKFAVADFIGDTTYTDFGFRVGRKNDGANGTSTIEHRGTGGLQLNAIDAGFVNIATSNTERLRIDASGNVGIGTASPVEKLDVAGIIRALGQIVINSTTAAWRFVRFQTNASDRWHVGTSVDSESGSNAGSNFFVHRWSDAGAYLGRPIHIDRATGRIGINDNATPSTALDVNGTVTATAFAGNVTGNLTGTASAIADGAVSTAKIVDGAVTDAKIASGVDASKLTTGTLPADRIGSSAITTARINDAAVTAAKLDGAQTGSAPIYGCRAWVIFDGARNATDTGASTNSANVLIRGSGNVSSVLKNATGNYTVNFTTAMPDANYATIATVAYSQAAANNRAINRDTASALLSDRVRLVVQNSSGTDEDAECYVAIFR